MTVYNIYNKETGRDYIGATTVGFSQRKAIHKYQLRTQTHVNYLMQEDCDKYGIKSFMFTPIEYCNYTQEELNERERYWIKFFESNHKLGGYNIKEGGVDGKTAESSKMKMKGERLCIKGADNPKSREVIHIESGRKFPTMIKAGEECGVHPATVSAHCRDLVKKKRFRYA